MIYVVIKVLVSFSWTVVVPSQCQQIYGEKNFQKVYKYLKASRSTGGMVDERKIMSGLREIVKNVRDCFLVDQLVFLEKQVESTLP